jgi:diaminopimelate decarboxylase
VGTGVLTPLLVDAGLRRTPEGSLAMDGVPLGVIAEAVGSPTYVYNAVAIRDRFARLEAAFGDLPHRICYAVKANGNLAILRLLHELGAGADIVSGGELLRALAAGFPAERIVFSGVGKTDEELQAAISAGVGHINVESVAELRRLAVLAEMQGARVPVGIRINPDVSAATHPYISTGTGGLKFGIPIDQLPDAHAVFDGTDALVLDALAMHLGSQIMQPTPWEAAVDRLLGVLGEARARGHAPTTLDIGGGIGIRYRDESPMEPEEWIGAIRERLKGSGCSVQIEPGRFLVGAAGVMLTRIVHRKHSGGREIAIVDAGMNDLLRPSLYQAWHEIVAVDAPDAETVPTDIVGPVCETGDFLGLARELPPVPAGALLAVLGAGAYAFAMSSNYNARARAAEVLVDGDRWAVVRPRERLVDLFASETADPFADEAR